MVIIIFYSILTSVIKFTLSTITSKMKKDNISLDVCYKFFMINMLQLLCYNFFMIKIADKPWQVMLHAKPFRYSKI